MSRGETVLEGFALLEATNSRTHRQSLSVVKDLVVVGKLDMIHWVVSSTRQGERQVKLQHASRTREPVGVPQAVPMRGPVASHACADFSI